MEAIFNFQEKKDRKVEMTQLNAILSSNKEALQNLHDERRKQMKVFKMQH